MAGASNLSWSEVAAGGILELNVVASPKGEAISSQMAKSTLSDSRLIGGLLRAELHRPRNDITRSVILYESVPR
jgi:hypothetical protein